MIAATIADELKSILGTRGVLDSPQDLSLYEYDGGVDKARPDLVVFPRSTDDLVRILQVAKANHVTIVGRGAGTGLSGGAIPRDGGIIISFARMNRMLELDLGK
jgi:FAD/FMN-containing dehydrogenases